ncbi:MAG TPA: type II toxin-antitoxin system VapC family toxin [Chloroflexota bacterium]
MYVMDTNVISELRRSRPHGGVLAWLQTIPNDSLYLSAVTLGELQAGVEATRERDPDKATEIEAWIDLVAETYQVLPMDGQVFRLSARLLYQRPAQISNDGMIAATAMVHGFTMVTRNIRDFRGFPVPILNPFEFGRNGCATDL